MWFHNSKQCVLGLDIGSATVKFIVFERKNSNEQFSLVHAHKIDILSEGIIDKEDLYLAIYSYLKEQKLLKHDICIGIPQYLTTTQIRDFPEAQPETMKQMVSYETQHLAGLSEDTFVNDFHIMPAKFGRTNPVFIGICRDSVIQQYISDLKAANIDIADIGIASLALFNTLIHFYPTVKKEDDPQLLIDMGHENSTLVIIASGQILHISSLLFGTEKYEKLSKKIAEDSESPITLLHQQFLVNIQNALAQWKQHERPELSQRAIKKIWLSGGGTKVNGILDELSKEFNCDTTILTLNSKHHSQLAPEYTTAYGLALQQLGDVDINISLCPENIRWTRERTKNTPYLFVAVILLIIFSILFTVSSYLEVSVQEHDIAKKIANLNKCETLIQELNSITDNTIHFQRLVLPIIERASISHHYSMVLNELSSVKNKNIIFIYLGDYNLFKEAQQQQTKERRQRQQQRYSFIKKGATKEEHYVTEVNAPLTTFTPMKSLILIGLTICNSKKEHYNHVREIEKKLNKNELFKSLKTKVDILPEDAILQHPEIIKPWLTSLIKNRTLRYLQPTLRYRLFALQLPFAKQAILHIPQPSSNDKTREK